MSHTRILKNIMINGAGMVAGASALGAGLGAVGGIAITGKILHDGYPKENLTRTSRFECRSKAVLYSAAIGVANTTIPISYPLFKILESRGIKNPLDTPVPEYYDNLLTNKGRSRG
jgi:hypothetical protein